MRARRRSRWALSLSAALELVARVFCRPGSAWVSADQLVHIRAGWVRIRETVHLSLGADVERTASFFACGMLGNALTAMGLPVNAGR